MRVSVYVVLCLVLAMFVGATKSEHNSGTIVRGNLWAGVGSAEAEAAYAKFDAGGVSGLQDALFNDVTERTVRVALTAGSGADEGESRKLLRGRRGGAKGLTQPSFFQYSGGKSNRAGNDEEVEED